MMKVELNWCQRLALMTVPCMGLASALVVIYWASHCDIYSGLHYDSEGHVICKAISHNTGAITANVAKAVVVLLILLTVTFTITISMWQVMRTQCQAKPAMLHDSEVVAIEGDWFPVDVQQVLVTSSEEQKPPCDAVKEAFLVV